MTKLKVLSCIIILLIVVPLSNYSSDNVVREDLVITNIEVPVRVFYKGKLVDGLKKSNFKLYEDNKLMDINGFFVNKKKIGSTNEKKNIGNFQKTKAAPRFFVLAFQITDYNDSFKKGVSYLFNNVLRDNDQVLIFVNNKTILMNKILPDKRKVYLEKVIKEESLSARQQLLKYFVRIRMNLNYTKTELIMKQESETNLPLTTRPAQVVSFLKEYLSTWKDYKQRYLIPDIDNYYRFAEFLTKINLEKWVINFYQTEMFPVLKYGGEFRQEIEKIADEMLMSNIEGIQYGRMILKLLAEIDFELKVAKDFDSEEVSRLFYKAGATFHSVISSSSKETASRDLEFRPVSTDIENSLRQITAKTGGKLLSTRDLRSALDKVSETEDIYYLLTYAPVDPVSAGKIRVKVDNKSYSVIYDDNKRADYIKRYLAKKSKGIPFIKINELSFAGRKLNFNISDFQRKVNGSEENGNIIVNIKVKDGKNETISNRTRKMVPTENSVSISINFDWLTQGSYTILANVSDALTSRSAFEYLKIDVK